ncbi:E3 ubiquitin-protein ligase makorin-1-like isoform X2 [Tachypleus tridentatus]|uniref:E3 ubiquitin-protein ligase makorin-1-like isoform X2 n=2 Tax=Tachypleus tridentatus TaxID=6853 RepID=UPI003FD2EA63
MSLINSRETYKVPGQQGRKIKSSITSSTQAHGINPSSNSDSVLGGMTILRKQSHSSGSGRDVEGKRKVSHLEKVSSDWVNAPEFVPRSLIKSYAEKVKSSDTVSHTASFPVHQLVPLCPYTAGDECPFGNTCQYLHGEVCDICNKPVLHPLDETQRSQHRDDCLKEVERDMELSFAVQRSVGKCCGICMEPVLDKQPREERLFGILQNCNHVFCVSCIRKWRSSKEFSSKHIRACPECRVSSDFVTPSQYWVEEEDEKKKIIENYKQALSAKPCKYFRQGQGVCPFGGACFYLHAYPDGRKAELPPPRPRRRQNQDGELETVDRILLWDFFDFYSDQILFHLDIEDMLDLFTDTDSEYSDLDL